jgi:NAD(P)-dependent dehydrogenase (short-subunit alcohol dehydrogenase family)
VVADLDHHGNQDTARMIEDLGGQALAVSCDVTRSEDVQAALTKIVERFGRMDYAFNNAGAEQQPKPTADITEEEWDRIITINLKGVFLCLKYQIPLLLQHGDGAIVNTASGAGIKVFGRGAPTPPRNTAWSASPKTPHSTTPRRTSGSTPSAPASSTPR